METLRIDIINPKAKRIIKELAELNLINIQSKKPMKAFEELLDNLRSKKNVISLAEINKEVELVWAKRYSKKS